MMALEDIVLIRVGTETYAVPEPFVERACPAGEATDVPTVDLRQRLRVPGQTAAAERTLILCHCSQGSMGLLADGVVGRESAVIKPLPPCARRPELQGAIVTGAGQVVLVLDIERL
jgi:chemotaxis protein histidine kinase CheA